MEKPQIKTALSSVHRSKFTMPASTHWLQRPRLYAELDVLRERSPVVWFSAAAGCGKTVLAASYLEAQGFPALWYRLDRRDADSGTLFHYLRASACEFGIANAADLPPLTGEYAGGETVFARNFAETLFASTPADFVLVLDDFQELPEDAPSQALLPLLLESVPAGRTVFVLSRHLPPAGLARLRINQGLAVLDESRLHLTLDETRALLASWPGSTGAERPVAEDLLHRTGGWLAGTILTLQGFRDAGETTQVTASAQIALFDYFGRELLAGLPAQIRDFLLSTALLPQFDIDLAGAVSSVDGCAAILDELLRRNLFLYREQGGIYRYHPLFHQLLLQTVEREWSAEQLTQRRLQAAELLLAQNALDAALPLLAAADAWSRFIEALLEAAPVLMTQGRHRELHTWLQRIPEHRRHGVPWLTYWRATALLPTEYDVSYALYSEAYDTFRAQAGGAMGMALAWIGAVDAIIYSLSDVARLDAWLVCFESEDGFTALETQTEIQGQLASRIMSILTLRRPDHPDLPRWQQRAEAAVRHLQDVNQRVLSGFYLITQRIWGGELDRAATLIDSLIEGPAEQLPPLAATTCQLAHAWLAWTSGRDEDCSRAWNDGLKLAEQSGVYVWRTVLLMQGATNALIHGDCTAAEACFERLGPLPTRSRDMDRVYYHLDRAWLALSRSDALGALEHQRRAVDAAEDFGAVYSRAEAYFGLAQVYHELHEPALAWQSLERARQLGKVYGSWTMAFQCGLASAQFALDAGDESAALVALRPVLEQARRQGVVAFNGWRPPVMARLCALALRHDICHELVEAIIRRFRLLPPASEQGAEWPWPVRITTLGGFALEVGGRDIDLSGHKHRRPCDLLKQLVAAGTQGISESHLAEDLWPALDGDAAMRNLRTNLHRLRRLLADDDTVTSKQGRLTLNPALCWSDSRALGHLLDTFPPEAVISATVLAAYTDRLLALLGGPFLPGEEGGLIFAHRIELQRRLRRRLTPLAERLQAADEGERVAALIRCTGQFDEA